MLAQDKDRYQLLERHALEVTEQIDCDGNFIVALDEDEVLAQVGKLRADGTRAVPIFLF